MGREAVGKYLKKGGLEIGGTLCLGDELSSGIRRHPTGRFCVIMPMRVTIPAETPVQPRNAA